MILLQLFNQFLGKTAGGLWGQSTAIGCKLQTAPSQCTTCSIPGSDGQGSAFFWVVLKLN
ncbi:hypothetical protein [Laspinema olomoucense]|uniref:hypothetical protein n=1 Tax=Laspinema olomoucense TaxID=3231600 RepID=UPI0021BB20FF|nr:hypothetical protein [Laspinema sp. D3a]MCT7991290.1 hypothetical protein [Laspinema sp. D3a]